MTNARQSASCKPNCFQPGGAKSAPALLRPGTISHTFCRQWQFHSSILLRFKNESYLRFDSLACRRLRVEASTQCRDMVPADSLWTQKEAPKTNSTVKEIECTKRLDPMVYTLYGPRYGMVVTVQRAQECYAAARSTTTLRARGL